MIQYSYIGIWSYILANDCRTVLISCLCTHLWRFVLLLVCEWTQTYMCVVQHQTDFPFIPHYSTASSSHTQTALSQPAGLDVWTHTPAVTPRQPRGGGECFLSPHTHTHARPGSPCTGVKGPRRVGCQNTTLINIDVSLDDVSLLLKNRGEIKWNEEMHLYMLRFGLSALMNLSLNEHTHTSSSR